MITAKDTCPTSECQDDSYGASQDAAHCEQCYVRYKNCVCPVTINKSLRCALDRNKGNIHVRHRYWQINRLPQRSRVHGGDRAEGTHGTQKLAKEAISRISRHEGLATHPELQVQGFPVTRLSKSCPQDSI